MDPNLKIGMQVVQQTSVLVYGEDSMNERNLEQHNDPPQGTQMVLWMSLLLKACQIQHWPVD